MKKKIIIISLIILTILFLIGYLYQTFALSNIITKSDNEYIVTINDNSSIEIPARSSKKVYYKITNINKGKVKYGIGYSGENVEVKVYEDTPDAVTGLIDYGESKFVKLKLINNGTVSSTVKLSTILGYEHGGDLIVPNGTILVTKQISKVNTLRISEDASSENSTFLGSSLIRSSINSISITSDNLVAVNADSSIDVSKDKDGSVMMWWIKSNISGKYDVYIGSENGTTVASNCYKLFSWLTSLSALDLTYLNTSNVTDMSYMFFKSSSVKTLDLSFLDTSKVTNMKAMFSGCMQLTELDVSSFNTKNVVSMVDMFANCQNIEKIDLSSFVTPNVTNINGMFYQNYKLTSLNIINFNTEKVTDMQQLFNGCKKLSSIKLTNFKTNKVTNFYYMFNECSSLIDIDVSSFDTSSATNMVGMFRKCSSLKKINLSSFNTDKVTSSYYMFLNCTAVTEIDIRKADFSNVTNYNLMFSGIPNNTKIYVKNATIKSWITQKFSNLTGVTII